MRAIWPAHAFLVDFNIMMCVEYCAVFVASCHFIPFQVLNILPNILFFNTLNLYSSFVVSDQVSHPYKITSKIIDSRFRTAFPKFYVLLIYSLMPFWFVAVVPRYSNFTTCRFYPAVWSRDVNILSFLYSILAHNRFVISSYSRSWCVSFNSSSSLLFGPS
jgi:hypothetical protein